MFSRYQSLKKIISSSPFKAFSPDLKYRQILSFSSNQNLKSSKTPNSFSITKYSFSSFNNCPQSTSQEDLALLKNSFSLEEWTRMSQLMEKYSTSLESSLTSNEIQSVSSVLRQLALAHKQAGDLDKASQYLLERNSLFQKLGLKDTLDVAQNYYDMASILWKQGNWTEAEHYFNEVDRICRLFDDNKEARSLAVKNWHSLAKINMQIRPDKALECFHMILERVGEISKPALANIFQEIGSIYSSKGDVDKTVEYWEKGLEIAISINGENSKEAFRFLDDITSYLSSKDQYLRAEPYAQRGLQIALKLFSENSEELAQSYLQLGSVYRGKQDLTTALDYYHSAVKIYENLPEEDALITLYNSYFQMGILYKRLGDHREASDHFNTANKTLMKFNREPNSSVVTVFSRWARQLYKQKMVVECREYYWKAIDVLRSTEDGYQSQIILTYVALGKIALDEGDLNEALKLFKESEKCLVPNDSFHFRIVNLFLGSVYQQLKDYNESLKCLQRVIESCENVMKSEVIDAGECFGDREVLREALEASKIAAKCDEQGMDKKDLQVETVRSIVQQIKEKIEGAVNQ